MKLLEYKNNLANNKTFKILKFYTVLPALSNLICLSMIANIFE